MNKISIIMLLTATHWGCHSSDLQHPPTKKNKFTTTHFNIIFAPDLSNRINPGLHNRTLNDLDILSVLTKNLYPSILNYKRLENQMDKFRIDFINKGQIKLLNANTEKLLLDFGQFKNQNERISYILKREGATRTLQQDSSALMSEFDRVYNLAIRKRSGSDIWSYLHQGIDNKKVLSSEDPVISTTDTFINSYRNILILTTDGYIEAGIFNKGFDLSQNTINKFRQSYLNSGNTDLKDYFSKNTQFRIKPVNNSSLKNLEILVMELYDRSLTPEGTATIHPTDKEIINLFWDDWFYQNKVKKFELHSCAGSKYEAEKIIMDFIGIRQ